MIKSTIAVVVFAVLATGLILAIPSISGTALGVGGGGPDSPSGGKGGRTICSDGTCTTTGGGGGTPLSGSGEGFGHGGQVECTSHGGGCITIHGGSGSGGRP